MSASDGSVSPGTVRAARASIRRTAHALRPRRHRAAPVLRPTPLDAAPAVDGASARALVRPGWLTFHVIVLGAVGATAWLGLWQLDVSNAKHFDLQNFGYTIQWWAFGLFTLFFWSRVLRDARHPPASAGSTDGQLVTRRASTDVAVPGPAELSNVTDSASTPVRYRGYVVPSSAAHPHRSGGDAEHASYNDYLWRLALADGAPGTEPAGTFAAPTAPADDTGTTVEHEVVDGRSTETG